MRDNPALTIGITCYNAASTIERAVRSAIAQAVLYREILIVDDASSDESVAVATKASAADPTVRIIVHERNRGAAAARNTIIDAAKGDFIVFFDDDDESYPERAGRQIATIHEYELRSRAKLVACYAAGRRLYRNGYAKLLPAIGAEAGREPQGESVADYLLYFGGGSKSQMGSGVPTCALCARRSTFKEVGGFDEDLRRVEDIDFAVRLALKGGHFIGTKDELFTQFASTAADKSPEKNLEAEVALADKHANYLRARGRHYHARHWPYLRYWHAKKNYGRFLLVLAGLIARNPLVTVGHLFETGPKRLLHERRMRQQRSLQSF